jgi:hypothetical protein
MASYLAKGIMSGPKRALGQWARRGEDMERTDWLNEGFDSADARFLMVTAITHHRFGSPM